MQMHLREYRQRAGLSQAACAAAIACSDSHIAKQETAQRSPNLETLEKLARQVLHCHPGELITFPEFGVLHCPCCAVGQRERAQTAKTHH